MADHTEKDSRLRAIWRNGKIPVVFRREKPNPLLVKLPYSARNYEFLRGENRRKPVWDSKNDRWELPVAWFDDLIKRLVERYGQVYVIQLYQEQQKCAPACWNAKGLHCECSCMGATHGTGHPGGKWYEVSNTFACSWGPKEYACRLIKPTKLPEV